MSLLLLLCSAALLPQIASTASLPKALQSVVPQCAWSCLASYIQGNYPTQICADSGDVDCLCSHTGVQGFTLQEGAFVCAHQSCAGDVAKNAIDSTYTICNGRPDALAATHTLLPTSFTASATQSPSATSSTSATSMSAESSTMTTSFTSSATTPTSASAAAATISPSATSEHGLSTPQIVGISVAAVAAVVVLVSIVAIVVCIRRRRHGHEQLDSGKLSSSEFTPPSIAEKRPITPAGMRDPRGGAGGVGIVPVRYKAIMPPANLFAPHYIPPDQLPRSTPPPVVQETSVPDKTSATPIEDEDREAGMQQPLRIDSRHAVLSGVTSLGSSHYSTDPPTMSNQPQDPVSVQRPPSVLLPGGQTRTTPAWNSGGRESTASQFTQFEEDAPLQSATIPAAIANRPVYPHMETSTSLSSSSQIVTDSSSSSTPPPRRSRGPSLRISIPGRRRSHFDFPPPPPRAQAQVDGRPSLSTAGAAQMPYMPEGPSDAHRPPLQQQQQQRHQTQGPFVTITSASPPLQFPAPPSGRLVAKGLDAIPRKDSVLRRGFSQPVASAYVSPGPSQRGPQPTVQRSQLTVDGERINYPSIPISMPSPPQSRAMQSPPRTVEMQIPPPPPGPPPRFAGPEATHSDNSSRESVASNVATSGSLLAKRRGSERAAVLESQLRIHNSHGSTSQIVMPAGSGSITHTPPNLQGPGYKPMNGTTRSPPYAQPALRQSPQGMNVRQWPNATHGRQPSTQRWVPGPEGVTGAPQNTQQQYVPYQFPPPPARPGARR